MSPEQIRGEDLDRRSDIYSLGAVLYEALTRQRLFRRESPFLVAKAILEEEIPPAHEVVAEIPPGLSAVIRQAMSRDKRDRQRTARALGTAVGEASAALGGVLAAGEIGERLQAVFASSLDEQREQYRRAVRGDGPAPAGTGDGPGMFDRHTVTYSPSPDAPLADATGPTVPDSPAASARAPAQPPAERSRRGLMVAGGIATALAAALLLGYTFGQCDKASPPDAGPAIAIDSVPAQADAAGMGAPASDATRPSEAGAATPEPGKARDAGRRLARDRDADPARVGAGRKKPGLFSIDSTPYATIYLGDRKLGITPLIRVPVPPGRHRVRARLKDGREQTFSITVKSGKTTPPRQLYW